MLAVSASDGGKRDSLTPYFAGRGGPGGARQRERLEPRFRQLTAAMANDRLTISSDITGSDPELVIVLEVRDSIADFQEAVRNIPGLEFLAELEESDEDADEGFTTRGDDQISLNFYVVAQNQSALRELQRMWVQWCANPSLRFRDGLYSWKRAFEMLKDIRPWSAQDRIRGTQLTETWGPRLLDGAEYLTCEIELWYRDNPATRNESQNQLEDQLRIAGCTVLDRVQIGMIAYHALLVRVPASVAGRILAGEGAVINDSRVSAARPQSIGASMASVSRDVRTNYTTTSEGTGTPLVAILDGVPMEGHDLLRGRIEVDDPDDLGGRVEARRRIHGTGMASAVVWGDLERGSTPLTRKVMVHPIFVTSVDDRGRLQESMPSEQLAVGIVHRALHRILIGTNDVPAVAPGVRVIILAAGHTALPYGLRVSPWGRLLDVWSNRRNILFVVSAGNYSSSIELDKSIALSTLDDSLAFQKAVTDHVFSRAHERRILSPSDAMNALTVGASHSDSAAFELSPMSLDVLGDGRLPSPASALGGGFNRQVKPEVYADGGRVLYRHRFDVIDRIHLEEILHSEAAPGVLVATAGIQGQTNAQHWMQGTSAATGLVGHEAAEVVEVLTGGVTPLVGSDFLALATKALLVNASSWSKADYSMADALAITDAMKRRRAATRLLGYGVVNTPRVAMCDAQKITVIATGRVRADSAQELDFPIPETLSGRTDWRRVAATLTWFTPVNARHKAYRQARLWFEPVNLREVGLSRKEASHEAVRRGTTQHEVFEGERRIAYGKNAALKFRINCAAGAGGLLGPVRYSLVLTFEVGPESDIPVYNEISVAVRAKTRVLVPRTPAT